MMRLCKAIPYSLCSVCPHPALKQPVQSKLNCVWWGALQRYWGGVRLQLASDKKIWEILQQHNGPEAVPRILTGPFGHRGRCWR